MVQDGRFMISEGWAPGSFSVVSLSSQRNYPSLPLRWWLEKQDSGTHRHTTRRVTTLVVVNSDTKHLGRLCFAVDSALKASYSMAKATQCATAAQASREGFACGGVSRQQN